MTSEKHDTPVTVKLTESQRRKVDRLAQRSGVTRSTYVRTIVQDAIEKGTLINGYTVATDK